MIPQPVFDRAPLPSRVLVSYGYGFGEPLPRTPRELASRKSRLDIHARVLLAYLYAPEGRPALDRGVLVVIEGLGNGSVAAMVHSGCAPPSMSHPLAYAFILDLLRGGTSCPAASGLGLEEVVATLSGLGYTVAVLIEDGLDIGYAVLGGRVAYIVGSNVDPPAELARRGLRVSIGPYSYHADQVAAFLSLAEAEPELIARGLLPPPRWVARLGGWEEV